MALPARPLQATVFSLLFGASAAIMAWLALDAYAYYLPALPLLAAAVLLWRGCGLKWFKGMLVLNQLTAVILILDLWLGDALHLPKLTISAAMLGANLLLGGPLMGVLSLFALASMHFSAVLPGWLKGARA
ncbi:hypothetical protein [Pseudoduganella sp. OTU4001]|uniref:hypothetical protein n=1 Tax=Pseudoduganella sp. OTU4001 TaxID=3043854 RepID=UPI00313BB26E